MFSKREMLFKPRDSRHKKIVKNWESAISLKDIKAVQLINSNKGESCRINLILQNNKRVNVLVEKTKRSLINDVETLAEFLDVPLLNNPN